MARRSSRPPAKAPAQLSAGDVRAAPPKLKRRLAEVEAFDPRSVSGVADPAAVSVVDKTNATLAEIFGPESLDYDRYRVSTLYMGPLYYTRKLTGEELVGGHAKGKASAASKLQTAISMLEERLEDEGVGPEGGAPRSLDGVDLHRAIEAAAGGLFRDGHHASAVENACKALNALVQGKSGIYEVDFTDLARRAFSAKNPVLAFNDLISESDRSEQEGMMHLYEGAFLAFRNPRAHNLVEDDPAFAYGAILTINFLALALERAVVRRGPRTAENPA